MKKIEYDSDNESHPDSRSEEDSDCEEKEEKPKKINQPKEKKVERAKKPSTSSASKSLKPSDNSTSKKRKMDVRLFDDLKVAVDMSKEVVREKRVKLSSNLIIESRMVEVRDEETKKTFNYPAVVFLRKIKDGKIFEFNVPLNLCKKLVEAINIVSNE